MTSGLGFNPILLEIFATFFSLFLILLVLVFVLIFSFAIDSAIENVDDGKEVFGKLRLAVGSHFFIENQDLDSIGLKDPFNQFECKAAQSVSIGNHNFGDDISPRELQDG